MPGTASYFLKHAVWAGLVLVVVFLEGTVCSVGRASVVMETEGQKPFAIDEPEQSPFSRGADGSSIMRTPVAPQQAEPPYFIGIEVRPDVAWQNKPGSPPILYPLPDPSAPGRPIIPEGPIVIVPGGE